MLTLTTLLLHKQMNEQRMATLNVCQLFSTTQRHNRQSFLSWTNMLERHGEDGRSQVVTLNSVPVLPVPQEAGIRG